MPWDAYQVTRPDGSKKAIIFPKVSKQFTFLQEDLTLETLLTSYPEYPIEAHVFVSDEENEKYANQFGFFNVIKFTDFAGEVWRLDNGSVILFQDGSISEVDGQVAPRSGTTPTLYFWRPQWGPSINAGAVVLYRSGIVNYASIVHSPVIVTDTISDFQAGDGFYFRIYYGTNKLNIVNNKFPYRLSDIAYQFFDGATPIYITDDPYGDGGETEPGGGEGDFDNTSVDVTIPTLPTLSAVDAGFITLFNPSLAELQNLASYMWSDLFDVNGWKKIFADPMNAILGLSIVPVNVPAGAVKTVKVGNISTGISMTTAASQYVTLDCGTLDIKEYWGAYLDYDPYTKAEIYLPYIGTHALAVDDIMKKSVHVEYHIDILSGACCAYVQCGGTVLYSFVGQCSSALPITGDNWTNVINGALSIAGSIGTMVATGGASAPFSAANIATAAVNSLKPSVEKSGAMGGTGGLLAVQTPYLILTRPRQALPRDQSTFVGYPSYITEKLEEVSGYTEIESIHLENVPATESELSEIESLLKSGVIF